ncbi:hypothetical protein GCM10010082_18830 [Kushneria pakistanensis]|uniref:Uncharacterized protein n=1 Tax=Kushneria pakistanensis TaxID=1508770 RepID=A0ABQ3FIQ5_9GAMM|nr:hypothetical protein [Kushneria pakistanensis]GHC26010.1 hypothetical protein GCM10010082_18830 [Kushneria pakistanensis]
MEGIVSNYRDVVRKGGYTLTSEQAPPRDTPLECIYIDNDSQSIRTTNARLGMASGETWCAECGVTEALISGSSSFITSVAWRAGDPGQ